MPELREKRSKLDQSEKLLLYILTKATEYYWKREPTCLSELWSFSKVIPNWSMLQINVSKLDRYSRHLALSVWLQMQFHVIYM